MKPKNFSLTSIFPNPFARIEFEGFEELNRRIHEYALAMEQAGKIIGSRDDNTTNWGNCFQITLFREQVAVIEELAGAVRAAMNRYLAQIGLGNLNAPVQVSGWIVMTRAGGYNAPHAHPHGTFSTIYHALMPEKPFPQGCIEFINPLGTMAFHSYGSVNEIVPTKPGTLFILPSYLVHYVHPFEGPGERISVNMDFAIGSGPAAALRES
jgi:Putative 2OG-Fe(II) oxygenase